MIALKAFLGKFESGPLVLRGKSKVVVIDLAEIKIKKQFVLIPPDEIENVLRCKVAESGDYISIIPYSAIKYLAENYNVTVFNNIDQRLLEILEEWFMSNFNSINMLVKKGHF